MRQLQHLLHNLRAGVRLALFMPVRRPAFHIGIAELLILLLVSAGIDFVGDWIRYGPDAYVSLYGAGNELFSAGILLVTSGMLGLAFRQRSLVIALPVVVLSAVPVVQLGHLLDDAAARWWAGPMRAIGDIEWLFIAWLVILLVRAVAICLTRPSAKAWPRAVAGGLALAAPLWLAPVLTPAEPWWRQPAVHGGVDPRYPNPASEAVLTTQATLLDDALNDLDDERPGVTDLYFVAFGGHAAEDVFRKDVDAARKVMDARWDTRGRSITLLNNPRTLLQTPMATVSNLRETLNEIADAMDPEEDVVMIYLASHGRPGEVEISLPPLELTQLTPAALRSMLDDAGITWRIIVLSSCYSGSFIPELADEHTMIIAAAQANRASFGCGYRSNSTYFGEAFFTEGLGKADSLPAAFDMARARIAEREKEQHVAPPSNPQIFIGSAMADKLKELEPGNAAGRAGQLVMARSHAFGTDPVRHDGRTRFSAGGHPASLPEGPRFD